MYLPGAVCPVSTVSKALNDYSDISVKTRELVHRTAREIGQYTSPRLTTIRQDTEVMGTEAARLLIGRVDDTAFPLRVMQVPVALVSGESLGCVPSLFA